VSLEDECLVNGKGGGFPVVTITVASDYAAASRRFGFVNGARGG
jgi:hypothetical protein